MNAQNAPLSDSTSAFGTQGSTSFELPPLPYGYAALEPVIDAETMRLHYEKHHRAYVDGLNAALSKYPGYRGASLEWLLRNPLELPDEIRTAVHNMGGGHYNHSLFWRSMTPGGAALGIGMQRSLDSAFGSFDRFRQKFEATASKRFGAGWVYLVATPALDYGLEIVDSANQDTPLDIGCVALLACDLWEHAYYLKYRNRRADWLKAWWSVVDWRAAAERWDRLRPGATRRMSDIGI